MHRQPSKRSLPSAASGRPSSGWIIVRSRSRPAPGSWARGLDLLFAHWPVPEKTLRNVVPNAIPIDTYDGFAWIGITPFEIVGAHPRGLPPLPWLSRFPELNVRTYTTIEGRPGIWFFSLDAARAVTAAAARLLYRLPYRHAHMAITRSGPRIHYRSRAQTAGASLRASYQPTGPASHAADGTLEHFLTERYCLYTLDRHGDVRRADIHHAPWPLQPARAELTDNTVTEPLGIRLPGQQPLLHYAARQDVLVWPLAPDLRIRWPSRRRGWGCPLGTCTGGRRDVDRPHGDKRR